MAVVKSTHATAVGDDSALVEPVRRTGALFSISVQLALVLYAAYAFRIEENFGFLRLIPLVWTGFIINAVLPQRLRMSFFFAVSVVSIFLILPPKHAVGLIGLAGAIFATCHLPVAFRYRVAVLVGGAAVLALVRAQLIPTGWEYLPTRVLPILGAMFMFRVVLYLYYIRFETTPTPWIQRFNYFLLLPNAFFPLFPVIDYRTYLKSYYRGDEIAVYRKGIHWLLRGIVHLILYRVVYYYFTPSPADVQDLAGVVQLMVSGYLLYLRVSGVFHVVVGILCLFGFDLPETHNFYFLAHSFTDFWRRINIYWKDFMMHTVYYPVFTRFKKLGMERGMVITTMITLVVSWLLHSYQWFWLLGKFPLKFQDGFFWVFLGVLVSINTVIELRYGNRRRRAVAGFQLKPAVIRSSQIVAMFAFMCVMWSFWTTSTVEEWVSVVKAGFSSTFGEWAVLATAILALVVIGIGVQYFANRFQNIDSAIGLLSMRRAGPGLAAVGMVLVAQVPHVFGETSPAGSVVESLKGYRLNERDEALLTRGYYEELLGTESFTSGIWNFRIEEPVDWIHIRDSEFTRNTDNVLLYELLPNQSGVFKRAPFSTNRWGMRDQDYELEKPDGVYRIAMLGASFAMGTGVAKEHTMEARAEAALNGRGDFAGQSRVEILNFSVGGYSLFQQAYVLKNKAEQFEPDAILLVEHGDYESSHIVGLLKIITENVAIESEALQGILDQAGITDGLPEAEVRRRLAPHAPALIETSYREMVDYCRVRGIAPMWVDVPMLSPPPTASAYAEQLAELARSSGFIVVELDDPYGGFDPRLLQLAAWDKHPGPKGHELLAEALTLGLAEKADELHSLAMTATERQ